MADIGNVIPARLFETFDLRNVLEKAYDAGTGSILRLDRNDRDPKRLIGRQMILDRLRRPRHRRRIRSQSP